MPETKIGLFADRGASYFLTKGKNNEGLGIYLALTGQTIKGMNLVWCGIATHFVPKDKLEDLKQELIERVDQDTSDEVIQIIVNKYADHEASKEDIPNIKLINMLFNQSSLIRIIKALEFTTSTFAKATLDQLN